MKPLTMIFSLGNSTKHVRRKQYSILDKNIEEKRLSTNLFHEVSVTDIKA